jgi:hypothetical protein
LHNDWQESRFIDEGRSDLLQLILIDDQSTHQPSLLISCLNIISASSTLERESHDLPRSGNRSLRRVDRDCTEVEDASGENGIGTRFDCSWEVLNLSRTATGDQRK